ncbi:MAG: RNA 2',3'-cyclic phosphodiesterase [Gammaproteobacteria bacterium]|nr:MAG: RNA 2',3'-cyclic phosphodiesterase [Gammaproteobacteria bacterium]
MSARPAGRRRRLFFGLPLDASLQAAVGTAVRPHVRGRGRRVPPENLHLTLAFLGAVAEDRIPQLAALAAGIAVAPFTLELTRLGYWARPRVIWLAPASVPPALAELAAALRERLEGAGFPCDARPFAPHVTLVRKAGRGPAVEAIPPLSWPVDRFCLFESRTEPDGARYVPLACWPLTPAREEEGDD